MHTYVYMCLRAEALEPLELELQLVVSHRKWVQVAILGFSETGAHTLNCWTVSPAHLLYFVCVVYVMLCIHEQVCMPICMCLEAGGWFRCLTLSHCPCCLETWSVSKSQQSSCLHLSQHEDYRPTHGHTQLFAWVLGIQTQIPMFVQQAVLPTEPSFPAPFVSLKTHI